MWKIILMALVLLLGTGCSTKIPDPGLKNALFEEDRGVFEATASVKVKDYNNIDEVALNYAIKTASKKMFMGIKKFVEDDIDKFGDSAGLKKTAYFIDNKKFVSIQVVGGQYNSAKVLEKNVKDGIATVTIGVKKKVIIQGMNKYIPRIFGSTPAVYSAFKSEYY